MSGDIREQAASRHKHRRNPNLTKDEALLSLDELDLSPRIDTSPRTDASPRKDRSPRDRENLFQDIADEEQSPRSRTGGRQIQRRASMEANDMIPTEAQLVGVTPTFIKCKCQGKELKAMINTAISINLISKSAAAACGLQSRVDAMVKSVEVTFGKDRKVKLDIKVESDCSDLVLGVDFLKMNMCQLDFANSVLLIGGSTKIPFLTSREVPLKHRSNSSPASSL